MEDVRAGGAAAALPALQTFDLVVELSKEEREQYEKLQVVFSDHLQVSACSSVRIATE